MIEVKHLTVLELLRAHGAVLDELRRREILRSANSPISDYGEVLFCRAFSWTRAGNSAAGFDATDAGGQRYQIKARRTTKAPGARQLSAIRNLAGDPFDQLAAVLFSLDFSIQRAALIAIDVVRARVAPLGAYEQRRAASPRRGLGGQRRDRCDRPAGGRRGSSLPHGAFLRRPAHSTLPSASGGSSFGE